MLKASINGFGRIGRTSFRVWAQSPELQNEIDIVAINTSGSMDTEGWATLLKYDTPYGVFKKSFDWEATQSPKEITEDNPRIGTFSIQGKTIPILAQRNPAKIPWAEYGVDIVLECTGIFRTEEKAGQHLQAGAKRVLLSAPGKGGDIGLYLMGVHTDGLGSKKISSNASCTTNCVAPVMQVLNEKLGVHKAVLTTTHAYTDTQNLVDNSNKGDLYRTRAAASNLIPTSTGAAKATAKVMPELENIFDGMAIRSPVVTGSVSDITALVKRKTTKEEVNGFFREAAASERYRGILAATEEPLVSSDIIGMSESSIVALPFTMVVDGDLVKVLSWYDNEWAYCARLVEMAVELGRSL
ncbi:MAG: type I glyceraldehyde-3-phosphate dehydrogenase [Desulfovibrionales bacterium]